MRLRRRCVWWVFISLYGVLSVFVMTIFVVLHGFNAYDWGSAPALVAGTAARPPVYRLLVPLLIDLTKNDARRAWRAAGFTGDFNAWRGHPHGLVGWQSLVAGSLQSACSSITVG